MAVRDKNTESDTTTGARGTYGEPSFTVLEHETENSDVSCSVCGHEDRDEYLLVTYPFTNSTRSSETKRGTEPEHEKEQIECRLCRRSYQKRDSERMTGRFSARLN